MAYRLAERLISGPRLIADGATGTMLQAAGLQGGTPTEVWNVTHPEKIRELHETYLKAGSTLILTNTFGGNRVKLRRAKAADLLIETNRRAVEIALLAAQPYDALVIADMGPTGELLEPFGSLTFEDAANAYAEQAKLLAEGGVDGLWIETLSDGNEARAAVEGIQRVTSLPVLVSFSFDRGGRTMMGLTAKKAAETFRPLGVAALGSNCGASLDDTLHALEAMAAVAPDLPLIAKPNAGLPRLIDGESIYDTTPDEMAAYALRYADLGARILGGCCGSTPDHIAAIARAAR